MFERLPHIAALLLPFVLTFHAAAESILHNFAADAPPYDPQYGWAIYDLCGDFCNESVDDGVFSLHWVEPFDFVNFSRTIARAPDLPATTLWVEWGFRSNHARPHGTFGCDGRFSLLYRTIHEVVYMYADSAFSSSGDYYRLGLDPNVFHSYRFESPDGVGYTLAVDGHVFVEATGRIKDYGYHRLQFSGLGGCVGDWLPNQRNEWDFIRYGTISFGERIVSADPPSGFLNATTHPSVDRFTIAYDSPNYVYVHEITVESLGGPAPQVLQTRRLDNGPPDVVEIVLDRPVPTDGGTRFILDDGQASNVISFVYALQAPFPPADADLDLDVDLHDLARLQDCFRAPIPPGAKSMTPCVVFDLDASARIDASDLPAFPTLLTGPR